MASFDAARNRMKKIYSLQMFRGFAALLVLLFHVTRIHVDNFGDAWLYGLFAFGRSGVDFFFVLSGFIIFYIHEEDIGKKEKSWIYFRKRFVRILPVYWSVLVPVIIFNIVFPTISNESGRALENILKSVFLIPQNHLPVLGVAWTLSHEMLFYLLFGIFIAIPRKWSRFGLYLWIGGTLFSYLFRGMAWKVFVHSPLNELPMSFLFSPFNIEFFLGVLAAWLVKHRRIANAGLYLWAGSAAFLLFGLNEDYLGLLCHHDRSFFRIYFYGIPCFFVVMGAACIEIKKGLKTPHFLRLLGDASYSLYLVHYPAITLLVLVLMKVGFPRGLMPYAWIVLGVCVGILYYQWVELRLLRFFRKILRI